MNIRTVDLVNWGDYSYMDPDSLSFNGEVAYFKNWSELCADFFERVEKIYPDKIERFAHQKTYLFIRNEEVVRTRFKRLNRSNVCLKLNYSTTDHLEHIRDLIRYCQLDISNIKIQYRDSGKRTSKDDFVSASSVTSKDKFGINNKRSEQVVHSTFQNRNSHKLIPSVLSLVDPPYSIPSEIRGILTTCYSNGFEFNNSTIRDLETKTRCNLPEMEQKHLKKSMFKRRDGLYFLYDSIVPQRIRFQIYEEVKGALEKFNCFELDYLYKRFSKDFSSVCIRNLADFEDWFFANFNSETEAVDYVTPEGNRRIVQVKFCSQNEIISGLVHKIQNEFKKAGGKLKEEQFQSFFNLFSIDLLERIIQEKNDTVFVCHHNDLIQFQTLDTLNLPHNFSDVLMKSFDRIEKMGFEPTLETINVLISMAFNGNFRTLCNIGKSDNAYCRLIKKYYRGVPREWKGGLFKKI